MNIKIRPKNQKSLLYFLALPVAVAFIYAAAIVSADKIAPTAHAQNDPFLERRISQIEQRFNFIETRISRIEQEARTSSVIPGSAANDAETRALRSEVEILRLRVAQLECAAVRLDERTLTEAARRSRRENSPAASDPCRSSPNQPLNLPARP